MNKIGINRTFHKYCAAINPAAVIVEIARAFAPEVPFVQSALRARVYDPDLSCLEEVLEEVELPTHFQLYVLPHSTLKS